MLDKSIPHIGVLMVKTDTNTYPRFDLPDGYLFSGYLPSFEIEWAKLMYQLEQTDSLQEAVQIFQNEFLPQPQLLPKRCLFVLDSAGTVVATASLWFGEHFGEVLQRIHYVAASPNHQGKGLVKALITKLLDVYNELGYKGFIYLSTQTWSYKAINIYSKFGFTPYIGPKPVKWKAKNFEMENKQAWQLIEEKIKEYEHIKLLAQNKASWNAMADDWFGVTALPVYGCLCPTEDELNLFGDITGKKVLDIGCGSGHSLKWCGDHGATGLWGLDISERQLKNAQKFLAKNGYAPKLFCSPMEENPGLPIGYFDVVYSIYAIGWTVDLQKTFDLISAYLKQGGVFIFSWDHPFMHCVETVPDGHGTTAHSTEGKLIFSGSYFEQEPFTFEKGGNPVTLYNRRLSDYINALAIAGFAVERVVEETDKEILERDCEFSSRHYAPCKAKRFPLTIIVKARKIR